MIDEKQKGLYLLQAEKLCHENDVSLLFLTLFGSTLYGTEMPGKSDVDIRGIFLPSKESLALNAVPKSLHYSTSDGERSNTASDVDIDLWSIQHWLLKLLPNGDTGALDMLFAPSHEQCVLFCDSRLDAVFKNHIKLIDVKNGRTYMEYSLGQVKKYGIKGSRIGALKNVHKWLRQNCPAPEMDLRLRNIMDTLAENCADGRFCAIETVNDEPALQLCGKMHVGNISMKEFSQRVEADILKYGCRAAEAEQNQGIDFKAISHALRALDQMEELLITGKIVFPLKNREELIAVKEGRFAWPEVEAKMLSRIEDISILQASTDFIGYFDQDFAKRQILLCYGYDNKSAYTTNTIKFHSGFSIPPDTLEAIQQKLNDAEQANHVKILFACESGSRGWGFASKDSDFDVRFIYVHHPEWYLGIAPEAKRDVLELGIENTPVGELDINGWELRKALKLFRLSNAPILEWLSSPLIYRELGPLASLLRDTAPSSVSPSKIWHHYRSLMEKSRAKFLSDKPSIKTWFYMLRPLLVMRWIENGNGVPPMRFDSLIDDVIQDARLRRELELLVDLKKHGAEQDDFTPPALLADFVQSELKRLSDNPPELSSRYEKANIDAIFRYVLKTTW